MLIQIITIRASLTSNCCSESCACCVEGPVGQSAALIRSCMLSSQAVLVCTLSCTWRRDDRLDSRDCSRSDTSWEVLEMQGHRYVHR